MVEIKALIADDELPARGELKYELSSIPGVKVVGECANGREVIEFLRTHPNVDLLFLDIEMPIMNGLEAAEEITRMDLPVKIVFATGYSQFAVQAFDLEAFDYILKPYDEERIGRTIQRLADSISAREQARTPGEIVTFYQKISLQTKDRTIMISPSREIVLISTEKSDRSLFYTTNGIIESKMTLRDVETLLSPLGFFRSHKGYIVNLSMIQEILPQDNGTLLLSMNYYPKEKVPVSRHYIRDFKQKLHL
ncbi:MAG: LytTR family DNA-binding domain-containing protein [Dialister sp.]|nr:LytTR family DNA-binding domain-containing protein [Dialister sp.]